MSSHSFDIIIIGAGIMGTFHAYHAALQGRRVLLIEKDAFPQNATVRNFGQIVPSGMSSDCFSWARRSLDIYMNIQNEMDIAVRQLGSVYIASDEQENKLIHELHTIMMERGYPSHLLTQEACLSRWPSLKRNYVKEGLYFPNELSADPTVLIHRVHAYLKEKFKNLQFQTNTIVTNCEMTGDRIVVTTNNKDLFIADKVIICNGSEFKLLFPDIFLSSGIVVTKLQMMKTKPLPEIKLSGNILTGLTIRRYESFRECPSLAQLTTTPYLQKIQQHGIHILFKQEMDGSIIIGDSHEYKLAAQAEDLGFDVNSQINRLILDEAERILDFDSRSITSTWNGYYSQHPEKNIFEYDIDNRIHIRTAIGGKGMTVTAGYAEASLKRILQV